MWGWFPGGRQGKVLQFHLFPSDLIGFSSQVKKADILCPVIPVDTRKAQAAEEPLNGGAGVRGREMILGPMKAERGGAMTLACLLCC